MNKTIKWFYNLDPNLKFFAFCALATGIVLIVLDYYFIGDWRDILVEAHGLLFDLLIFGILLTLYDIITSKKRKIDTWNEEIDDYRGWNEQEATYRIIGCVRRLIKVGAKDINLSKCYLENGNFDKLTLKNFDFFATDLESASFDETVLENCIFTSTFGKGVWMRNSKIVNTDFGISCFEDANFEGSTFDNCDLWNTHLKGANLTNCTFDNCLVPTAGWFKYLKRIGCMGVEGIEVKYYVEPTAIKFPYSTIKYKVVRRNAQNVGIGSPEYTSDEVGKLGTEVIMIMSRKGLI